MRKIYYYYTQQHTKCKKKHRYTHLFTTYETLYTSTNNWHTQLAARPTTSGHHVLFQTLNPLKKTHGKESYIQSSFYEWKFGTRSDLDCLCVCLFLNVNLCIQTTSNLSIYMYIYISEIINCYLISSIWIYFSIGCLIFFWDKWKCSLPSPFYGAHNIHQS